MKNIDTQALEVISDIVCCPDDYSDETREIYKDTVNQIYGVLLLRDAVRGEEERRKEE